MRKQKDEAILGPESAWWHKNRHADRRPILLARNRIKAAFRQFFEAEGFTEVECGQVQRSRDRKTRAKSKIRFSPAAMSFFIANSGDVWR